MSDSAPSLQSLIRQHEPTLRRFVLRRSGRRLLAKTTVDDLFQELVTQAMQRAAYVSFPDDGRFLAWMQQVLRGVISHSLRTHGLHAPLVRIRQAESSGPGVSAEFLPHDQRSPSSLVAVGENCSRLRQAIEGLPSDYRRAVVLYRLEGYSLEQVAESLDRSKGAVVKLVARGLIMLAEAMEHP